MSNLKKNILKFVMSVSIPLMLYLIIDLWPGVYEFKVDGITVGYIDNKTLARDSYKEYISEIKSKFKLSDIKNSDLEFNKIIGSNINLSSSEDIKNNIKNSLNIDVNAKAFILNDKVVGYVSDIEEGKKILKELPDLYIKSGKIDKKNIIYIRVNTNSQYKDEIVKLNKISSKESIKNNIIKLNSSEETQVAKVEICLKDKVVEASEPTINVMQTSTLYLGESIKQEGLKGEDEVVKKEIFINGKLKQSNVLEKKSIVVAKPIVILKGTKNPIAASVPFLNKPTRGGFITSPYGERHGAIHHGMDIGEAYGAPITAALDGVVKYTGYNDIYGNMLILDHGNGIETVYGHASEILAKKGACVKEGELIGKVGSTGNSTGPHLHFELRTNGMAINPKQYIK
ncbi:Murein DD-endopeptidase MepM and murein hydrolase activator NlpD, contain LysM domain [Clostridium cavendishii DSM 21758]|uniref:Murein DD-endopeptidase MepM and murein hydrolase activator NlpD, contain LysM domain n=2 Tax=Clostridium TaxID=1485 RepID=A0A1M6PT76_9CLOT|nr:Murein DD-endopeptidase MepM and murein hydrolase activator NlpD, contain LysM domain [Clostridium cavendishii DSM 21758]